jgi:hypothetical protein
MNIEFGKPVTMKILAHNLSSKYRANRFLDFFSGDMQNCSW